MSRLLLQPAAAAQRAVARPAALRTDIQALRALAVGAVLLYHLWPTRLTGGYIGVDVFFVISGYLITSHLLRELESTGGIRLGVFWARRARRLLPASLLVLLLSALATILFVPQSLWKQFLTEVGASALYAQNWLLAANSVDYLAAQNAPSPVQHYWTLSVEEQFYVALPLLLLGSVLLFRRAGVDRRRIVFGLLIVATAVSFAYGVWLTETAGGLAYFSTGTRAWEFGVGAIVSFVSRPTSRATRAVIPIAGFALIVIAAWTFDAATPFPGVAALLPVLGAALILGGAGPVFSWVGRLAPVAMLGRTSYAVYLWHWPLIVLVPYVSGHPRTTWETLAILGATILLAWLSTRWFEEPMRYSPRLLGRRAGRTVAAWSAAATVLVLAVSGAALTVSVVQADARRAEMNAMMADSPDCLGAQSRDPGFAPCLNPDLEGTLVPHPADLASDDANRPECWAGNAVTDVSFCRLGPETGYTKHLMAVGDSHNNTLLGAYRLIAESKGWRIDVTGKAGCYWTTAVQDADSGEQRACAEWKDAIGAILIADDSLDGVITTHSASDRWVVPEPGRSREESTIDGLVEAWSPVTSRGIPVIAIRDNPRASPEVISCVERSDPRMAADECVIDRAVALANFDGSHEAASRVEGSSVVDLTDLYCERTVCRAVIGNVIVYRDHSHITDTYARSLAPYLAEGIEAGLGRRG